MKKKKKIEHFKMINRRMVIQKFCNNSKLTIILDNIRALVFLSLPGDNFSLFEYLCLSFLLTFPFILIKYTRVKTIEKIIKIGQFESCFTICFNTTKPSHVLFLFN